jgi:mono/diheme cytochrome c family protein
VPIRRGHSATIITFLGLLAAGAPQAAAQEATLALGKKVFLEISQPPCGLCHTLADAKSEGEVGPKLDELKPDLARVRTAVTKGIGPMPPNEILTKEQIEAVALYVSTVTNRK